MTRDSFQPGQRQQKQKEKQEEHCNWLSRSRKNQPQWNALSAASLIFVSGGMSLAWGAGFAAHSIYLELLTVSLHMQVSWYAAAIVGALLSALLTHRTPQRPVYVISACLVLLCGVLFLALPDRPNAIIAARYLDGLANGLVFVPTLCNAGEVSVCEMRGVLTASVEQLSYNVGICLMLFYTAVWQNEWNVTLVADQLHGLFSVICGVVALALALTLYVESPVHFLLQRKEQAAVVALRYLQRPYMVTCETFLQLDELKRYVAINRDLTWPQSIQHGLVPLLKVFWQRSLHVLSLTPVVWRALLDAALGQTANFHTWPYVVFGLLRCIGCICAVFLMDSAGRKKPSLFGAVAGGAFAITFATFFESAPHTLSAFAMLFSFQFFAGVAHAASAVYLTEAFPLATKPYFIALVYTLELLIRLSICIYMPTRTGIAIYFYVFGGISLAFALFGICCLPETKGTSLAKAHFKIRKWIHIDFKGHN